MIVIDQLDKFTKYLKIKMPLFIIFRIGVSYYRVVHLNKKKEKFFENGILKIVSKSYTRFRIHNAVCRCTSILSTYRYSKSYKLNALSQQQKTNKTNYKNLSYQLSYSKVSLKYWNNSKINKTFFELNLNNKEI